MTTVPLLERARRRISAILKLRRLSQAELARRVSLHPAHLSQMLNPDHDRQFPVDRLDAIAHELGVPTYTMFLDDPSQWTGRRDWRRGERRSGMDRRRQRA